VLLPGTGGGACDPAAAAAASVTYGVHRHVWARCAGADAVAAARVAARRLGELAAPGAAVPPLSADGALRLEFALCNAAPQAGHHFSWDFAAAEARFIAPMAAALAPLASLRVGSSVLLHTPLGAGVEPAWDAARRAHVLPAAALSQLVDPQWPLHAPGGAPQERVLQLLAYVPPATLCPLALPHGAPGFTSPGWGGVVVWNPAGCGGALNATRRGAAATPAARELSGAEMRSLMALFAAQLRTLLGLPPTPGADVVPAASAAFAAWEVDALARRAAAAHAAAAAQSLAALGRVVTALPGMVISDAIAALAGRGLRAAAEATRATAAGQHAEATAAAASAHAAAEGAFFHPSILSLLYFPSDHKLAVYLPLFLPALLPLVLAAMREGRHYKRRRAFAAAFRALAKDE
jgi:phosphatidylinositol glycan class S